MPATLAAEQAAQKAARAARIDSVPATERLSVLLVRQREHQFLARRTQPARRVVEQGERARLQEARYAADVRTLARRVAGVLDRRRLRRDRAVKPRISQ